MSLPTGVIEGRNVHYVLPDGPSQGQHRAAIIVKVWSPETVNLQVLTDDANDNLPGLLWRTSVRYSGEGLPDTWHFIERTE